MNDIGWKSMTGAGRRIRTDDLLITNQLLYQLSYAGEKNARTLAHGRRSNKLSIHDCAQDKVPTNATAT